MPQQNSHLIRRLMAAFYDGLLLLALWFVATGIALALNGGEAIQPGDSWYGVYVVVLISICYGYFTWFWSHGGQTLGMKTWRIRLVHDNGIDMMTASLYFIAACLSWLALGGGYLLALVHPRRLTLHDILLKTNMLDLRHQDN